MKAVAYLRVSSVGQVDGGGFDRQLEAIRRCADLKQLELTGEYREEAVPGKFEEDKRPAFQRMISDLLSNGCRTIIVESLDRLAREYRIQESLIIYIASKGLALISANTGENITEAMLGDPMRRALVQIQGILAELDKNMIVAKLKAARERKKALTGKCEGAKAFGTLPGEAFTLVTILGYDQHGFDPKQIAAKLNADGAKTRFGKRWHGATVWKILDRHESEQQTKPAAA